MDLIKIKVDSFGFEVALENFSKSLESSFQWLSDFFPF